MSGSDNIYLTSTEGGFRTGRPAGLVARASAPADPPLGCSLMWMDENGDVQIKSNIGGVVRTGVVSDYQSANGALSQWQVLSASAAGASVTNTLTETALATITIPAGAMGPNGILRVTTLQTVTNSANNKNLRVRLGGISGTVFMNVVNTTIASHMNQRTIQNRNSQAAQVGMNAGVTNAFTSNSGAVVTGTVDTSIAQDLVITGQMAALAETITLESYLVEIAYRD